jgi:hypothetical protein
MTSSGSRLWSFLTRSLERPERFGFASCCQVARGRGRRYHPGQQALEALRRPPQGAGGPCMQDLVNELPSITIPRCPVNKRCLQDGLGVRADSHEPNTRLYQAAAVEMMLEVEGRPLVRDCIAPGVVSGPCGVPKPCAPVAFGAATITTVRQLPEQCASCERQIATLERCVLPDGTEKRGAEGGILCTQCAPRPPQA